METQSKKKLVYGMMLTFGLHILIFGILGAIASTMSLYDSWFFVLLAPVIFIGLAQLIYVLPIVLILKRKEEFTMMKGVIIAGVITALLNGGCWLMVGVSSW